MLKFNSSFNNLGGEMLGLRNKVIMFIVLMVGISLFSTGTGNSGKAASYNPFTLTITKATYLYMKPGGGTG